MLKKTAIQYDELDVENYRKESFTLNLIVYLETKPSATFKFEQEGGVSPIAMAPFSKARWAMANV